MYKKHLPAISSRLSNTSSSRLGALQIELFIKQIKSFNLDNATALSISCGDGMWDYLALKSDNGINRIVSTDIVENPVSEESINDLNNLGTWDFVKVVADSKLPFTSNKFDIVYHQDVIEHVRKPYLFLSEQYRVLRPGGGIVLGTPNLFRPANIVKILLGKLRFPIIIGSNIEIGEYLHEQEFNEYQLIILMEEAGFKNVTIEHVFFGLSFMNIVIKSFPKGNFSKGLSHFLIAKGFK